MSIRRDLYRIVHFRMERWNWSPSIEVPTVLAYRPGDPWAVTARFLTANRFGPDRVWTFGRELLAAGLDATAAAPAGQGDVLVCAGPEPWARITLTVDQRSAGLLIERERLTRFLAATYRRVPPGEETWHADLDALADALRRD